MGTKSKKTIGISLIVVIILVALDQLTKQLAVMFLKGQQAISIIPDVFELKYLENQSAAFGIDPISILHKIFHFEAFEKDPQLFLNVKMFFFVILTIVLIGFFCFAYIRIPNEKRFRFMDYILICFASGAIGNFIDRLFNNYVIDFFYFKLIDFPIFNVADIYVTCSAFTMLALGIFYYKDEDLDKIFPPKNKEEQS